MSLKKQRKEKKKQATKTGQQKTGQQKAGPKNTGEAAKAEPTPEELQKILEGLVTMMRIIQQERCSNSQGNNNPTQSLAQQHELNNPTTRTPSTSQDMNYTGPAFGPA